VLKRPFNYLQYSIRESGFEVTYDDLRALIVDETQIGLVLQNLIRNAIRFRRDEVPLIHVSPSQDGKVGFFSVRDNGIGIEPAYLEWIFVMFRILHAGIKYQRTRIGLAICRK